MRVVGKVKLNCNFVGDFDLVFCIKLKWKRVLLMGSDINDWK